MRRCMNHDALRGPTGEVAPTVRWHRHEPLVPETSIKKERSTLSALGVYREPWQDEGQRTDRQNEFDARRDQHEQARQRIKIEFEFEFAD